MTTGSRERSRREFLRSSAAAALFSAPVLKSWAAGSETTASQRGPVQGTLSLDGDWLFGGKLQPGSEGQRSLDAKFNDAGFAKVTLPHCPVPLSWQKWDPAAWQDVWLYRRHFAIPPEFRGLRLFLHFDRVMTAAAPVLNGHALPSHVGGFLPFEYEITPPS